MVNSNIAISSLPTLQISIEIVTLFEKIHKGEPDSYRHLKYRGEYTKCVAGQHNADIGKQLLSANNSNAVLGLSMDGACTNFRENSLKRDLLNDTTVNFLRKVAGHKKRLRMVYVDISGLQCLTHNDYKMENCIKICFEFFTKCVKKVSTFLFKVC